MIIAIAWLISLVIVAFFSWLATDSSAYQRGYKAGRSSGEVEGRKVGYEEGLVIGHKSGDAEGYERGRKDGIGAERALQALHRETVGKLSTPSAQAQKPVKFRKRATEGKKRNGARKSRA